MKVLHLPTSVGNHGYSLALTERRHGLDSKSLVIGNNYFQFRSDISLELNGSKLRKKIQLLNLFFKIYKDYDIYHFNFGQTLIDFPLKRVNLLDLPFYKGRKFMTFNGSDLRQLVDRKTNPYTPFSIQENDENIINYNISLDNKKERIAKILRYVDHCFVVNPDLMRFISNEKATYIPFIKSSWFDIERVERNQKINKTIKIVHAPTNRMIKGTDYIINAVNNLKNKYPIDFTLVENMSHENALKIYRSADLIIDQIRIGWYGGFALEAMKMGIPVAVYINKYDLQYVPYNMKIALNESVVNVNPQTLEDKLRQIIENRDILHEISDRAYEYVSEFHNPDKLINIIIDKYREHSK
jgi:glycosyltransferase involved in cell wall biosynthesis